ncbi:MAG: hypothetical protein E6G93_11735 [Alphaproteobacteria bacterium]|nr:MAG: hypothetical protein E6G93_11735 [Alphaproteobacteria bacterium]
MHRAPGIPCALFFIIVLQRSGAMAPRQCAVASSPSPRLRGESRGEGDSPRTALAESPPHPDRKGDPTSPRKRGEVTRNAV